ncbi:MAG: hypothetical protein ACI906_002627 [Candidatus Latescibacterota bacterium]
MKKLVAVLIALGICMPAQESVAQVEGGSEMLNEVPIWPVPAEMTMEEYRDANRRLGVGVMLMSVPLPGAMHFYAGERAAAWKHVGAAALGTVSLIVGAAMLDDKNGWKKSNFEVVDVTGESGKVKRYEKIPVEEEGGVFTYRLEKLDRKTKGGGGAFIAIGAGLIVGQLIHDWIGGIKTIERKRDAVRYKYGKTAGYTFGLQPSIDIERGSVGAQLSMRF